MKIPIKYFADIDPIEKIEAGSWIDLRASEDVNMYTGQFKLIPLGVGLILPEGYEAIIAPRSSTFKHFGIIVANSIGVIDPSYCGEEDQWMLAAFALREVEIKKNERICQFRIQKVQPDIEFEVVDNLKDTSRGGFGSTGKA